MHSNLLYSSQVVDKTCFKIQILIVDDTNSVIQYDSHLTPTLVYRPM